MIESCPTCGMNDYELIEKNEGKRAYKICNLCHTSYNESPSEVVDRRAKQIILG